MAIGASYHWDFSKSEEIGLHLDSATSEVWRLAYLERSHLSLFDLLAIFDA